MRGKILLIEDNEQNAYLVEYLLAARDWTVVCAADGSTGLEMADTESPNLILLDIQLPGMDGYEVARQLRAKEHIKETPIVAVTSYAMPGDRENCLAAGCTGYIEKPIDPGSFADQVEQFLGVNE
ncbi:response regulator [Wenzhouxiangella sp. EGI_FJ10305]|uniref:response regulator n=1 Tax=Wenzhouxiangella sp. EGI_FJ10305 TaxID=3243768 RepID=UPI0035E1020D